MRILTPTSCSVLAAVASLVVVGLAPPAQAQERKVTAVSWGGSLQETFRKTVWGPYTKETGVQVLEDTWNGELGRIKAQVDVKNVTWDIVTADYEHALAGCEQGLLVEIPASLIGDRGDFHPGTLHKCGLGDHIFSGVMAYDGGRLPDAWGGKAPTSVQESFDTKKFPGRRGLRKRPKNTLEQILMADGVPPAKVYEEVDKRKGFDRFVAKADSIKKDLVFFDRNEQGPQLLGNGEIAVASSFNARIYNANVQDGKKFVIIWDGQIQGADLLIIPKGPRAEEAMKLAAYWTKPEVLGRFSSLFAYGPTRKSAMSHVDPKMAPYLPTAPQNMKNVLTRNEEWWADHFQEIQEKFNAWLAKL